MLLGKAVVLIFDNNIMYTIYRQVLTAMETHSEDVQVVGKALQALASLALSSECF